MISVMRDTLVYMEFSVTASCTQVPVLAVGLTPPDSPLNVMVGSWPRSIGICSDGKLLVGSEWYRLGSEAQPCPPLLPGSTVGMLLRLGRRDAHAHVHDRGCEHERERQRRGGPETERETEVAEETGAGGGFAFSLTVNINGVVTEIPQGALFGAFADDLAVQAPLYPTVSLLSSETRVWCRFCEADIVYRTREEIGAPPDERIYCLDGSLLIDVDKRDTATSRAEACSQPGPVPCPDPSPCPSPRGGGLRGMREQRQGAAQELESAAAPGPAAAATAAATEDGKEAPENDLVPSNCSARSPSSEPEVHVPLDAGR
jgi:hypothetical protein